MKGCRPLNVDEVSALLADLPQRDRVLAMTGLYFGTRISETLALTFGAVAGRYIAIKSAKGSDNVTFEIPAIYRTEVEALKREYESTGRIVTNTTPLFLSRKSGVNGADKAINRQQASQVISNAADRLEIDGKVNSHSLRKTFVTKVYELSGKDIAATKKYSRHKNLANLDYYIGTCEDLSLVGQLSW